MRKCGFSALIIFLSILTFFSYTEKILASSGYGWGFKKNTEHKIPDIGEYKEILDEFGSYYADDSGEKVLYVTFDNGYEQGYTDEVLDVLQKENVPSAFFLTGHYVKSQPDLVKRMVDEGHIIGNHSYHHPDFTIVSKETMKKELETLEQAVADVSTQKELKYLRPPKGVFNKKTLKWSNELGYIHIFWSLAFTDWNTSEQKGWKYAYENIMKQIHPGAVILLHTVSSDNAQALDKLITELKKQGYTFKSLDHLVLKNMLPAPIYGY
ncbi:peptidoglycan-N-acetylmuramic acid deacetylase [Virgibacillus subterraneus]|uniref:Peptidoglycan-N-acetylmuramic acid deacetylase n=1 Tax=Virgibacillus subterraneus TaxID=621109 RepID=A0A1H9KZH4_9BACI|nr:delta-lactam-biosynthetic de-N-acetylase [Virgibacillus subterraneus]SER04540.1 peptidoglycan-N-acetylmuramic acid deacetylase [Virgibacillus subterraneus]